MIVAVQHARLPRPCLLSWAVIMPWGGGAENAGDDEMVLYGTVP